MNFKQSQDLPVIGSTEYVEVGGHKNIPAKIDTGADSSSVWASHIRVTKDGVLCFCLFDEGSPFYTGEVIKREDYKVAVVRNASGYEQIRYRTHLSVVIDGHRIKALFNLSDRSNNNFPILIGRRTISGKFLVDVSKNHTPIPPKNPKSRLIQQRLKKDPYAFHQEYIKKLGGNVENVKLKKGA
ncbi:ATP-dependent zinc protease [Candidatus Saccharibacteria bacterium]|nr:ATP-dependent zinc protease [Candidatus Saccharibacteria bacterium]